MFKKCTPLFFLFLQITAFASEYSWHKDRFHIGVDWLYWIAKEDNLGLGATVNDYPGDLKSVDIGINSSEFKYRSGFRVSTAYRFPVREWNLGLEYTYLPIHSMTVKKSAIGQFDTPHSEFIAGIDRNYAILEAFTATSAIQAISSYWKGNLNNIDLDLARSIPLLGCINLIPHIGLRAAWLQQTMFIDLNLFTPSINNATFLEFFGDQQYTGYGVQGGIGANWNLGWGFSFCGHLGGSILYSLFQVDQEVHGFLVRDGLEVVNAHLKVDITRATPTFDCFLGVQYQFPLFGRWIDAHVGWEQHIFFDMNFIGVFGGNFTTQGLNAGLGITF